jgi:hypothetical protein
MIPFLPNDLAEDVVGRQVSGDPQSIISANGNETLNLATTLVTGLGIVTKSTNTVYGAAAAGIAQLIINLATKKAPSATPYFSRLLPDSIPLSSSCGTWYVFSGLIRKAEPVAWEVSLP